MQVWQNGVETQDAPVFQTGHKGSIPFTCSILRLKMKKVHYFCISEESIIDLKYPSEMPENWGSYGQWAIEKNADGSFDGEYEFSYSENREEKIAILKNVDGDFFVEIDNEVILFRYDDQEYNRENAKYVFLQVQNKKELETLEKLCLEKRIFFTGYSN